MTEQQDYRIGLHEGASAGLSQEDLKHDAVSLNDLIDSVDAANGFANRILFLAVRRTRLIPFPESPDEHVHDAYVKQALKEGLDELPEREAKIIGLYYGLETDEPALLRLGRPRPIDFKRQTQRVLVSFEQKRCADSIGQFRIERLIEIADSMAQIDPLAPDFDFDLVVLTVSNVSG